MRKYFIVPEDIALANTGRTNGSQGLMFVKDLQGRWVVNIGVAEMWDDIPWNTFEQVELGPDDFMNEEEGLR